MELVDEADPATVPAQVGRLALEGRSAVITLSGHIAKSLTASKLRSPTVFATIADPMAWNIVDGMARRNANITGITYDVSLEWKLLEHLKIGFPGVKRVGILADRHFFERPIVREILESSTVKLGVAIVPVVAESRDELELAFSNPAGLQGIDAWIVPETPAVFRNEARILELLKARRVPTVFGHPTLLEKGAIMTFGVKFDGMWDEVARMVRKLCRGTPAREIPVVRALHMFLGVSVTNARAAGLAPDPRILRLATTIH